MMTTVEFISHLHSLDIKLWADGDHLRCNAPKGVLTSALQTELRDRKAEILAFLRATGGSTRFSEPPLQPVSRDGTLPLSFAQQRLWFIEQLEPGTGVYNLPVAYRVRGPLNLAALEQSLNEIVRRHEILRTTFSVSQGEPVQVIAPHLKVKIDLADLRPLAGETREAAAARLVAHKSQEPFDLSKGPLLRASLLQLAKEEHILLVVLHHIISDGWSMAALFRELAALYELFSQERRSSLPDLPIQYTDFAAWQRQWLQGEILEKQLSYWRKQLKSIPNLLELPTDRPRPSAQTFRGAKQIILVSKRVSDALKALCHRERVTLFMMLLAAFKVLLRRYTGQHDIVIGTPIAGRNRTELEGLIGFFVNTLVLRTDLSGNPRFTTLLRRVRDVALGAYEHQDLPFEKLVEELQPDRDLSRSPLVQVTFQVRNFSEEPVRLPGLDIEEFEFDFGLAKFDLALHVTEKPEGLSCFFRYNVNLFDDATIRRIGNHLAALLEGIVENPEQPISDLPVLTDTDKRQLLNEQNAHPSKYIETQCIHQIFEAQVERTPEAVAVVFEDQRLTYRGLNARANRLARYLKKQGAGPETLVGICVERSLEMIVGVLAILKSGSAYVPLDPEYPKARIAYILAETRIKTLLTKQRLLQNLPEFKGNALCLDRDRELFEQEQEENPDATSEPENLAYVMYTSGSTGKPKGVLGCHGAAVNYLSYLHETYHLNRADIVLQLPSLSFDASVRDLIGPLTAGASVVIVNDFDAKQPAALLSKIREHGVTCLLSIVPTLLNALLDAGQSRDKSHDSIRLVLVSGEALPVTTCWKAKELFGPKALLVNQYGPTECTMTSSYHVLTESDKSRDIAPLGTPIPNAQIYILDSHLNLVPTGVLGEVYIGGLGLARGYMNSPELTAERFIPDPFSTVPGARLYRTGDLARYRSDGNMDFLGRIDHQVKVRGFRIELGEIEAVLSQHQSLRAGVVVARDDAFGNQRLVAYVVPNDNAELDSGELGNFLRERLPEYMIPSLFVFLTELPLTPNRKVDRQSLPDPVQRDARETFVAPRTPAEAAVAAIWREFFRTDQVGIDDNFFELGGHSLQATQVVSRLRDLFRVELPLRRLFERPTVAGLARCIEEELGSNRKQQTSAPRAVPRPREVPLSFAQERLWFLEQLSPLSPVYNIPTVISLTGRLNVAALERSFNEIVRRHDVLRTSFSEIEAQPKQTIEPALRLALPLVDLSSLPETRRRAEALRLATEEARRPFDLAQAPLLRAGLWKLGEQDHVLLVAMHHIISDGWSLEVFFRELSVLYHAFSQEKPSPLPELSIQYADFALWQRQWLQGDVLEDHLRYWKQHLQGAPFVLELPIDRPRPAVQTFRGAKRSLPISKSLVEGLVALSNQHSSSFFMTLFAAFAILLYRYTDKDDIVVGSPIANRTRREVEDLIGYFVNTLALRIDLKGNPTFLELLSRVRKTALGAYEHQDMPFEKLVDELQPERDLSRNPLFQVMFALQKTLIPARQLPELTWSRLKIERGVAKFALTLWITEAEDSSTAIFEYNSDLFEDATTSRMLNHFQNLLESIVADPEQRLSDFPMLTEAEKQQLLFDWNDTRRDYPKDLCIHQLFEAQAERTPDAVAAVFEDHQLSYCELNHRANQLARYLRTLGVGAEVLVGICVERSLEMIIGLLGILKSGGAYVPLDPGYPKERLAFMLEDAQVPVLLTQRKLLGGLPNAALSEVQNSKSKIQNRVVICLDTDWEVIAQQSDNNLVNGVSADNLAYVIYTSGSTGQPKGATVPHRAVNRLVMNANYANLEPTDVVAQVSNCSFDAATFEIWGALLHGAKLVLITTDVAISPKDFAEQIEQKKISVLFLTTALFNQMARELPTAFKNVRHLLFGGEAADPRWAAAMLEHDPPERLLNVYGPTEATTFASWHLVENIPQGATTIPIGRPIANTEIYVLDPHLQPVPIGVPGELYIGGDGLARGYCNRRELTAEKFIPHSFSKEPGARLYKTGDLVRYLPDGNIEFLGRIDHQVKIRGFRIELGEIESVLSQHPAVQQTVVLAREDIRGEKGLVAYVVSNQQSTPTINDLRTFLKQKLPDYMVPSAFVVLDSLPLTPNGKLDHHALPEPGRARPDLEEGFVAPRTPLEESVARIWAEALGLEAVGIYDNFFELGGDSLTATKLAWKMSTALELDIPVRLLFLHQDIATLAETIQKGRVPEKLRPLVSRAKASGISTSDASQNLAGSAPAKIERRPLLSLLASGRIPPVDAAALGYLSDDFLQQAGLNRETAILDWYDNLPCVTTIVEIPLGRIAIIGLPRLRSELYRDKKDLVKSIFEALEVSRQIGARAVSLMGLLPSATDWGDAIAESLSGRNGLPRVTTGHATTVTAVVLAIKRILEEGSRDLARETVAFLGVGSIGYTSLRLMLRSMPHPKTLMICDVYSKLDWLQKIRDQIINDLGFEGSLQIIESRGKVPHAIYDASLIVGATNVPDLLDIGSVRPGTMIVDDSAPHCFKSSEAVARFKAREDILFSEGGNLELPHPVHRIRYLPLRIEKIMNPAVVESFPKRHPFYIGGCALASLLLSQFDYLTPTLGLVDDRSCEMHYDLVGQLGYRAAGLHCENYILPQPSIQNFRRQFGMGS